MRIVAPAMLALSLPLCACAGGSFSLDPTDLHLAVGATAGAYKLFCGTVGNADYCTKQDQKLAKKAAKGVNGLIDQTAPPAQ